VVETPKAPLGLTSSKVSMNNLTRFDSEGIEIFINELGESFSSISGAARMAGKSASTISRLAALRNFELQHTQVVTPSGSKTVALLDEDQIVEVLEKYNPSRLKQFAKLGIRTALHQIAGYKQDRGFAPQQKPLNIFNLDKETLGKLSLLNFSKLFPDSPRLEGIDLVEIVSDLNLIHPELVDIPGKALMHVFSLFAIANKISSREYLFTVQGRDFAVLNTYYNYEVMASRSEEALAAQQFQEQIDRTQLAPGASQHQLASIN
jgi:hypothetical protein